MHKPVAIVTGASSGLGLELSLKLSDHTRTTVGVARHAPEDTRWKACEEAGNAVFVPGDVAAESTVELAFTQAAKHGSVDLVVNCAGQGVFGPVGDYSRRDIDDALSGNLIGTILFSQAAFSSFRDTGGKIVTVMSTAAQIPRANESVYCASKWGARGYIESLRLEAKGSPVKIIAVYPGGIKTSFWSSARGASPDTATFMEPKEVAEAILAALDPRKTCHVSDIIINRN